LIHLREPAPPPVPTVTPRPAPDPEPLRVEAAGLRRTIRVGRGRHRREVTLLRDGSSLWIASNAGTVHASILRT